MAQLSYEEVIENAMTNPATGNLIYINRNLKPLVRIQAYDPAQNYVSTQNIFVKPPERFTLYSAVVRANEGQEFSAVVKLAAGETTNLLFEYKFSLDDKITDNVAVVPRFAVRNVQACMLSSTGTIAKFQAVNGDYFIIRTLDADQIAEKSARYSNILDMDSNASLKNALANRKFEQASAKQTGGDPKPIKLAATLIAVNNSYVTIQVPVDGSPDAQINLLVHFNPSSADNVFRSLDGNLIDLTSTSIVDIEKSVRVSSLFQMDKLCGENIRRQANDGGTLQLLCNDMTTSNAYLAYANTFITTKDPNQYRLRVLAVVCFVLARALMRFLETLDTDTYSLNKNRMKMTELMLTNPVVTELLKSNSLSTTFLPSRVIVDITAQLKFWSDPRMYNTESNKYIAAAVDLMNVRVPIAELKHSDTHKTLQSIAAELVTATDNDQFLANLLRGSAGDNSFERHSWYISAVSAEIERMKHAASTHEADCIPDDSASPACKQGVPLDTQLKDSDRPHPHPVATFFSCRFMCALCRSLKRGISIMPVPALPVMSVPGDIFIWPVGPSLLLSSQVTLDGKPSAKVISDAKYVKHTISTLTRMHATPSENERSSIDLAVTYAFNILRRARQIPALPGVTILFRAENTSEFSIATSVALEYTALCVLIDKSVDPPTFLATNMTTNTTLYYGQSMTDTCIKSFHDAISQQYLWTNSLIGPEQMKGCQSWRLMCVFMEKVSRGNANAGIESTPEETNSISFYFFAKTLYSFEAPPSIIQNETPAPKPKPMTSSTSKQATPPPPPQFNSPGGGDNDNEEESDGGEGEEQTSLLPSAHNAINPPKGKSAPKGNPALNMLRRAFSLTPKADTPKASADTQKEKNEVHPKTTDKQTLTKTKTKTK